MSMSGGRVLYTEGGLGGSDALCKALALYKKGARAGALYGGGKAM